MNDHATIPADPFGTPTTERPEQDNRHNAAGTAALRREITAEGLDAESSDKTDRDRWTASQYWSELDRLALIRAAVWITHADGFGIGITNSELDAIASREPERITLAARQILRRLSQTVTAPDADAMAVSGSEALAGILPTPE